MTDIHEHDETPDQHPLDPVERFAMANGWTCSRISDNELSLEIDGRWCGYRLWFGCEGELDAMLMSCAYDMKVPENRIPAVHALLAFVNAVQKWGLRYDR